MFKGVGFDVGDKKGKNQENEGVRRLILGLWGCADQCKEGVNLIRGRD